MKLAAINIISFLFFLLPVDDGSGELWFQNAQEEKLIIFQDNEVKASEINNSIQDYEEYIIDPTLPNSYKIQFLFKLRELEKELENVDDQFDLTFSKFRYKKGVEILKMLHEKILALDHHFTTLNTFHEIQELSNPNSYPEFIKIKENLKESTAQKSSVPLPLILDSSPIVALGFSVVSSIFGENNKEERERDLEEISCLLDFTVEMHSDLKLIFYETSYLMASNEDLKEECYQLF